MTIVTSGISDDRLRKACDLTSYEPLGRTHVHTISTNGTL